MNTYKVEFTRTVRQTAWIEVEAENDDEAREEADAWNISDDDWEDGNEVDDPEITAVKVIEEEEEEEDEEVEGEGKEAQNSTA